RKTILITSVLLIAVFLSMYLRWNHFVSEVYFRDGNVAFNTIVYLKQEESKIDYYLKQIESLEKDLNNFAGQFESLDPFKWHSVKEVQAKQSGVPYNKIQSEAERQRTILNYKNQIANQKTYLISQKNNIPGELMKQYKVAKESFLKSVRLNHTYGKSYFYLAALATEPIRIQELYNLLKSDPKSVLSQNGDDIQKIIPKKYRYAFYEPLSDLVKENPAVLEKINLADIQGLVDSLSIYELSLNTFTERNTFKAIAMRYHSLYQVNSYLLNNINNINNNEIERKIYGYFSLFFNGFANWARKTVNLVPGGWNRFLDWKHYDLERAMNGEDIYRYFATAAVTIRDPVNVESRELLVDLAQKEIITSINMELKNAWGVPDGVLDYLHALAREYQVIGEYQESVYTYDEILKRYKKIYEMLRKKVSNSDILRDKFKQFVEKFEQNFDSVLKKEGKDFLTTNFTPLIINNLEGTFDKFISSDFKEAEKEFQQELDRLTPSLWTGLKKMSIWKKLTNEAIKYPRSQIQYLQLSDESVMTIEKLLDSVVNLNFMLMYERYARFTNHYEIIREEAVKTIEELIRRYENESEDKILLDWSEVSFNAPKLNSKQEVLTFLNDTLKKYKE
ncbi:MAG: O-antigen ligase family protein, partial [Fervidobacterium sp.]